MEKTYQERLTEFRNKVKTISGKDIPELCQALEDEGKNVQEVRIILEHDVGDLINKRTLLFYMPKKYKDPVAMELGAAGGDAAANSSQSKQSLQDLQHRGRSGVLVSRGTKDEDVVEVSRAEITTLRMRARELNKTATELSITKHRLENDLKMQRDITQGLKETIAMMKEEKKPESKQEFKQSTMDTWMPVFSDIVHLAHDNKCPAHCIAWQKAKGVDPTKL